MQVLSAVRGCPLVNREVGDHPLSGKVFFVTQVVYVYFAVVHGASRRGYTPPEAGIPRHF